MIIVVERQAFGLAAKTAKFPEFLGARNAERFALVQIPRAKLSLRCVTNVTDKKRDSSQP